MLRDWPLKKDTPGEAHDHIHHQGIFFGHERISGANFWHIDKPNTGTIEQRRLIETRSGKDRALIKTLNAWKNKQGKTVAADTRTLSFFGDASSRTIDLEFFLHATNGPVQIDPYKDGVFAIRTHTDLRLNPSPKHGVHKVFGHAINSGETRPRQSGENGQTGCITLARLRTNPRALLSLAIPATHPKEMKKPGGTHGTMA
jgi:hypothetical protein